MEQITLDLIPSGMLPVIHASQYDDGRVFKVNLTENGNPYTLSNEVITLKVRKGDGCAVTTAVTVVSGNTYVNVATTEQMTAVAFENLAELHIEKDGASIGTLNFLIRVEPDNLYGDRESGTEIHDLAHQVESEVDEIMSTKGAGDLAFDNTGTDLDATNTEDAIKEVDAKVNTKANASDVYDKTYMDGIFEQIDNAFTGVNTELGKKADKATTYTKNEVDTALSAKANTSDVYNKTETYSKSEVNTLIDNLPEPMVFKGTLGVNGTITALPTASASNEGYTYKVITDGTYAGQSAKSGDVFVSNGSAWVLIPSGDEDNDTWRAIKVNGVEKLGNAISSGSVDFVDTDNVKFEFDANGNKIKATLSGIDTSTQVDEKVAGIIDDTEASESKAYSSSKVAELLGNKADVDGTYDNMTVGNAKQLKSNVGEVDKVPYLFRPSGGYIDIGESETDSLVGASYPFNQLVANPTQILSFTANANAEKNIQTGISFVANRVYYASYRQKDTMTSNIRNTLIYNDGSAKSQNAQSNRNLASGYYFWIFKPQNTATGTLSLWCHTPDVNVNYDNFNLIDLTQMFGSTIADYIYSLEQGTAGAGVAWFRNLFPKSYYAYNAGTLMSVKTSKHITTGFNQWDEEWELGAINSTTGQNATDNSRIRAKNYTRVIPSSVIYFYHPNGIASLYYYSENKEFLSSGSFDNSKTYTIPDNCYYIRFIMASAYGTTYNHDICINFHWDGERDGEKDGEYEPYVKHEYDYSGEREVTRYFGIVDLGTLDWTYTSAYNRFNATPTNATLANNSINCVCKKYTAKAEVSNGNMWLNAGNIYIVDSAYTDAQTFKTAMSGVYLVYELATPYTETVSNPELRGIQKLDANNKLYYYGDTCSDLPNPQIVDDFGTEEYVDNREVAIPVGHDTFYQANLRAKLEMAPDSPSGDGDYIVRQTNGQNEYVAFVKELPTLPSANGTYSLKCTISGSTKTLSWVADT